eukprot:3144243-Prymnesium_polylepis.1
MADASLRIVQLRDDTSKYHSPSKWWTVASAGLRSAARSKWSLITMADSITALVPERLAVVLSSVPNHL